MKVKRGKFDIVLNVLCLAILICTVLFLLCTWTRIPDKVPMHHDFAGNVDRWGGKSEIIVLPVISWITYLFLTLIERFPEIWNTGVTVTEENKERVYSVLLHLISSIKFIIILLFAWLTVQTAVGFELGAWFLPVFLLAIFGDLLYWLWRLFRAK